MSGGRAELGIGAAWYEREHQYFGIPFPPLGERFDRLEEQLAILTGLWDTKPGERFSFDGKHYQLQDCASIPRPAQPGRRSSSAAPGPGAPRRSRPGSPMSSTAAWPTGWPSGSPTSGAICEQSGRDPAQVRLSTTLPVCCGQTRAEAARRAEALGEPGCGCCAWASPATPPT